MKFTIGDELNFNGRLYRVNAFTKLGDLYMYNLEEKKNG